MHIVCLICVVLICDNLLFTKQDKHVLRNLEKKKKEKKHIHHFYRLYFYRLQVHDGLPEQRHDFLFFFSFFLEQQCIDLAQCNMSFVVNVFFKHSASGECQRGKCMIPDRKIIQHIKYWQRNHN